MRTTNGSPKCSECLAHDQRTAALMNELFSDDEQALLTMVVASTIQHRSQVLRQMQETDINRLMVQRDMDFAGAILGKFIISLSPERRRVVGQALLKVGVGLSVQHEVCPHMAKAGVPHGEP